MKTKFFFAVALFTLFLVGCTKSPIDPTIQNAFDISRNVIKVGALQSTGDTFRIITKGKWEIIVGASWLELSKESGRGNEVISFFTTEPNIYRMDRTAKLIMRNIDGSDVKLITILQEGSYTPILLAGSGNLGFFDGVGSSAEFNNLRGITVDHFGSAYVADMNNQRIRSIKLSPFGTTATVAGNNSIGNLDGSSTSATLYNPRYLAVDIYGDIYFTSESNTVRKVNSDGSVVTFARGGSKAFDEFNGVAGIVYSLGKFFVSDFGNNKIREISSNGTVTTLAGNGDAGFADGISQNAKFNYPLGLASDSRGNIFVADYGNFCIRKITPEGIVSTIAGSREQGFVDGSSSQVKFQNLTDIAVDDKNQIFVLDGYKLRKIDSDGNVTTIAINGKEMIESSVGESNNIQGISYGGGRLYVTTSSGRIYFLDQ